jgi:hypothetical protein
MWWDVAGCQSLHGGSNVWLSGAGWEARGVLGLYRHVVLQLGAALHVMPQSTLLGHAGWLHSSAGLCTHEPTFGCGPRLQTLHVMDRDFHVGLTDGCVDE